MYGSVEAMSKELKQAELVGSFGNVDAGTEAVWASACTDLG